MGWSVSPSGFGPFTKCNATTSGCGGACTTDPGGGTLIPAGVTLLGQPSLASDGMGHVVYVSRATNQNSDANLVVAAISTDGGMSFENGVLVNDNQCANGVQDLPHATFDTTTSPPTLWIVWRHKGNGSTFGACVRHGTLDFTTGSPDACGTPTPKIAWAGRNFGQAESVDGMDHDHGVGANSQGGLMIQAGDGAATVVYAGNDQVPKPSVCTTTAPVRMSWGSVTTFDGGQHWTSSSPSFFIHSSNYRFCVLDNRTVGAPNDTPSFTTGLRDFGFTRASNGRYYAAVHDTRSTIRIFESADKGGHWREFCPTHIGEGLGNAGSNENQLSPWRPSTDPDVVCPTAAIDASKIETGITKNGATSVDLSLAWPTIVADGDTWLPPMMPSPGFVNLPQNGQHKSRFVLTYLEGNLPGHSSNFDNTFTTMAMFDTDPISPNVDTTGTFPSNDILQPLTPIDPVTKLQTSPPGKALAVMGPGNTDYGDYMSIALKYPTSCAESFASSTSVETSIQCSEASAWPFWPNLVGATGVGLIDTQVGGTN